VRSAPAQVCDGIRLKPPSVEVAYRFETGPIGVFFRESKPAIRKAEHVPLLVVYQFRVASLLQQGQLGVIEELTTLSPPRCLGEARRWKAVSYGKLPGVLRLLPLFHPESLRRGRQFPTANIYGAGGKRFQKAPDPHEMIAKGRTITVVKMGCVPHGRGSTPARP
jgi:hypothetical protein